MFQKTKLLHNSEQLMNVTKETPGQLQLQQQYSLCSMCTDLVDFVQKMYDDGVTIKSDLVAKVEKYFCATRHWWEVVACELVVKTVADVIIDAVMGGARDAYQCTWC